MRVGREEPAHDVALVTDAAAGPREPPGPPTELAVPATTSTGAEVAVIV